MPPLNYQKDRGVHHLLCQKAKSEHDGTTCTSSSSPLRTYILLLQSPKLVIRDLTMLVAAFVRRSASAKRNCFCTLHLLVVIPTSRCGVRHGCVPAGAPVYVRPRSVAVLTASCSRTTSGSVYCSAAFRCTIDRSSESALCHLRHVESSGRTTRS